MDSKTEELKEIVNKYFEELDHKSLDQVLKICHYESYGHKQILQRPGKKDKTLFIILKGSARAYVINDKGQELNCHMRSEGFLFGDPKAFSDQAQELFIEAIGEVEILKFNVLELEDLGTKNPVIMNFYLKMLKEVVMTLSHRVHSFVTMNSTERYLDLIQWNPLYLETAYDKHISTFLGIKPLTLHRIKKSL